MAKNVVLGRGVGECLLVELSTNEWMVIDCFNIPETKTPAPIEYFNSIGLDPSVVIKKVLITHFHDDHVQGMSNLIELAENAEVYLPSALTLNEAADFYAKQQVSNGYQEFSGIAEFGRILDVLDKNNRKVTSVKHSMVLYNANVYMLSALSPSEKDCVEASKAFIALASGIKDASRVVKQHPNNHCITLNLQCNTTNNSALLGSDLEISTDPASGWDAAVSSTMAPQKKTVDIFKIPHHGSENGYHSYTVEELLSTNAVSVVTTFNRQDLPRAELIDVYKRHSTRLLATTKPKSYRAKDVVSPFVLKMIKSSSIQVKNVNKTNQFGYVELERNNSCINVILHKDAIEL
ncbi:MBL fold metallo-hydrolase [Vibrio cholerae]|nr:MBL fold metallo-hydrolase [Vibrio cholerae]